jgi:integrase
MYASQLMGEIERAIGLGTYTLEKFGEHFPTSKAAKIKPEKKSKPTFKEMGDKWLLACSSLSNGTQIQYQRNLNLWLKHFKDEPIDTIKYSDIVEFANSQSWKPTRRNNMLIPIRGGLEVARYDQEISFNPADLVKNSKVQKDRPDPLSAEEVDRVLQHMVCLGEQIVNVFKFSFFAGVSPCELICLKWGDVDFVNGTVRVQRALTNGIEHETKAYKILDVELNKRPKSALLRQKSHTFMKEAGYIFENPVTNSRYSEERPLRRAYWPPTLKALGMRSRHYYQTRHT